MKSIFILVKEGNFPFSVHDEALFSLIVDIKFSGLIGIIDSVCNCSGIPPGMFIKQTCLIALKHTTIGLNV